MRVSGGRIRVTLWALVFLVSVTSLLQASTTFATTALTSRSLTLGSATASASTTYTFSFKVATTGTPIKSVDFQACTTAQGACTALTGSGFSASSSTLPSQPTNLGAASGWTVDTGTADDLRVKNASNATNPSSSSITIPFGNVTNINTANTSFYIRITTYSDAAYTTPIDGPSTVAGSTSAAIQLTGTMPESLTFCTGATVPNTGGAGTAPNCSAATSGNITFSSLFSSATTSTATSQMAATTNAGSGYVITYTGDTLKSGANSITAAHGGDGTAVALTVGQSQFGMNLAPNTTPAVGAAIYNPGLTGNVYNGAVSAPYGTADNYAYKPNTATTVATSGGTVSDIETYTVTYAVNVPGSQPAGTYQTTLTYICTATY